MALREKEKDVQDVKQITKRYVPIDVGGVIRRWNLPVILSFGKVLSALLAGDTVVLRFSESFAGHPSTKARSPLLFFQGFS